MSGGTLYTSAKRPGGQLLGGTLCTTTPAQIIQLTLVLFHCGCRGVQIIQGFVRHFTTSLQVRSTKLNSLNDLPILSLSSERFTADLMTHTRHATIHTITVYIVICSCVLDDPSNNIVSLLLRSGPEHGSFFPTGCAA